jgi:hypothetical protein
MGDDAAKVRASLKPGGVVQELPNSCRLDDLVPQELSGLKRVVETRQLSRPPRQLFGMGETRRAIAELLASP